MPTLTINHQAIFYAKHPRTYQPDVPTLILLHGAGGSHLVWPPALRQLPSAAVFALDLPGHGRSAGDGFAEIEAYADSVVAFIETLNLKRIVLAGHSLGGAVAQTIGLRRLPQVVGLVLVGTGAKLRVSPAILDQILPHFGQAVDTINQFAWSPAAPPEMVSKGRDLLAQTAPAVMHRDFLACDRFDIRAQLAQIDVPALVIAAAADKLTPPKFGRFLADNLPQAQFVQLADAGHMMMVEKPAETAAAVGQFLAGIQTED